MAGCRWIAGCVTVLAVVSTAAVAADAPVLWLQRMQQAQWQRSYEGVVVYVHDGRVDQVRISSRPGADAFQRFASMSGDRRELLKSGTEVRSLQATAAPAAWPAMAGPQRALDARQLGESYHLQWLGTDRVAGFNARLIEAVPQDHERYGQRLWVDQESGLLLGAALIGPRQELLEQVMFAQLALDAPTPAAPSAGGGDAAGTETAGTETATGTAIRVPGFVMVGRRIDAARGLEQRVYSDGLATVSVYVERREGAPTGEFSTRRGAVQLYGRQLGDLRVVAVGAVPADATRRWVNQTLAGLAPANGQ
jgi:sigma-E factor negative regulatory protein RseB